MSVATPAARSLLCRSLAANSAKTSARATAASGVCQRHQFHSSAPLAGRRRSQYKSIKAEKMGLTDPVKMRQFKEERFPDYDDTDIKSLEKKYTPEQLEALMVGEAVVDSDDLVLQGRMRNDPYKFDYLEDFSVVRPVVDKRVKTHTPVDTTAKFMSPDEFGDDFVEFVRELNEKRGISHDISYEEALNMYEDLRSKMLNKGPEEALSGAELSEAMDHVLEETQSARRDMLNDMARGTNKAVTGEISDLEAYKYVMERNAMTGFDGGDTALAPGLPDKVPGVAGLYKQQMDDADEGLDPEGTYQDLKKKTGLSVREILEIFNKHTKILVRRFVSNQTRLGKIRSSYILAMAGNGDGRLGMGEAKSVDSEIAVQKAKLAAIQNMVPIRRYENRTIYGNVEGKVGGTVVQLYTRPPGFGLRVSHRMFEIARLAGISDLSAKMPRSRNPMNSVKACFEALTAQPDPETIAIGRGKKLVDARKVYYGGAVH
ncbi:37S ribosomal protein S5, mitochondrial [Cytospora mali]|uniref:Small ribosomal subunit protein uS5m n=1 Tax=Cytospora mali TaxID=578113 RepID=A0A194V9S5_CYTMA|nr:37S ribosomal protein S5, mitochondrial [Valsa mali var. pyri (nom. inval.)]